MKRILFLALLIFCVTGSFAQTTNYKAHAVFVFSIAKYSKWPSNGKDFVITVLGKSKLYDELAASAAGYEVYGSKIAVVLAEELSDIKACNMIIVTDGKSGSLSDVVEATAGQSTMIITEREGLYKKGAGISFFINDAGKLNFDLNLTEVSKRSISLSQNLTKLAAKVI